MSNNCACLRKFGDSIGRRPIDNIVEEMNYLLYGNAQEDCGGVNRKFLGFVAPRHLADRFDGLYAYTRTEAQGV